ncbi:MAG: F0F1 ATP synthase subunit A [bacterium]|nr:F0F1 ATP synthase subunit A [bacterium]
MEISLAAEPIFFAGDFPITNTMINTWLVILLWTIIGLMVAKKVIFVPKALQNICEMVVFAFWDLCQSLAGERGKKFFPLVTTIFIFIITCNWLNLLPGFGSLGIWEEGIHGRKFIPLLRGATSDLNTTVALALVSVGAIQYYGIKALGPRVHFSKFFNFSSPIAFFVGVLELISEFSKIISFSFRLFGNVFAGEVLLTVIAFLIPVLAPFPFYGLEFFVGFIQAFVFAMLTLAFLNIATIPHGEEVAHGT